MPVIPLGESIPQDTAHVRCFWTHNIAAMTRRATDTAVIIIGSQRLATHVAGQHRL